MAGLQPKTELTIMRCTRCKSWYWLDSETDLPNTEIGSNFRDSGLSISQYKFNQSCDESLVERLMKA